MILEGIIFLSFFFKTSFQSWNYHGTIGSSIIKKKISQVSINQLISKVIIIGKKLRKEANKLGFLNYPKTVLYSGASDLAMAFEWGFTTSIPIWTLFLQEYLKQLDPATKKGISKPDRNKLIFFLAPNLDVYIEVNAKTAGFLDSKKNHVQQINIFSKDNKYVSMIAHIINQCYKRGILKEIIWEKVKKKFQINQEQETQMWKDILEQPV